MKYNLLNSNTIKISNEKEDLTLVFLNKNTIRVFKNKIDDSLLKLNKKEKKVLFDVRDNLDNISILFYDYVIKVSNTLLVSVYKGEKLIVEDYSNAIKIKEVSKDFSLSELEGHKKEEIDVNFKTIINKKLNKDTSIYGLGDKASSFLNKVGYEYIQYNTDDPSAHNENYKSLYKSINFILVNESKEYYGIFYPSTYKSIFNLGAYSSSFYYIASYSDNYDYYLFLADNPTSIISAYSSLVGRPLLPSLKMLGNQQSRWSYANREEVLEVAANYVKNNLPLDYIHLDIDYMENYKVYTVSDVKFKDFDKMIMDLKEMGIDLVTIIDPAVKVEDNYKIYEHLKDINGFAKLNNKDYINKVWPGDSCYPNYFLKKVRNYLKEETKELLKLGITGIWTDMNEPASFNGPLPKDVMFKQDDNKIKYHDELHNLYGDYMARTISSSFDDLNLRRYVITRACFATTNQYSICWNGDNQSLWHHLEASLPQIMSMNICAFPFDGVDIGGFGGECNKELLIRWIEANFLSPFLRNHSSLNTRAQEPYSFDTETTNIYRKYLRIRYDLIPYLYDSLVRSHIVGIPSIKPLFIDYPLDSKCFNISDQILVGDSLLLAPILKNKTTKRIVYLPKGKWINYFTSKIYKGNKEYIFDSKLDETLLFIKHNSILVEYENLNHLNKEEIDTLVIKIYGNSIKAYINYEDDGITNDFNKGIYNKYSISFKDSILNFKTIKNGYNTNYKYIKIIKDDIVKILDFNYNFKEEIK